MKQPRNVSLGPFAKALLRAAPDSLEEPEAFQEAADLLNQATRHQLATALVDYFFATIQAYGLDVSDAPPLRLTEDEDERPLLS